MPPTSQGLPDIAKADSKAYNYVNRNIGKCFEATSRGASKNIGAIDPTTSPTKRPTVISDWCANENGYARLVFIGMNTVELRAMLYDKCRISTDIIGGANET